jgi:hypothetical protein
MLTYLVVGETILLMIVSLLVIGLLRSHADILQRLHALGHGSAEEQTEAEGNEVGVADEIAPGLVPIPKSTPRQDSLPALTAVSGLSLELEEITVPLNLSHAYALLAFLGTGCLSCTDLWRDVEKVHDDLPETVNLVVVTKDPGEENVTKLRNVRPHTVPVVMSSELWAQCEIPGSPYFLLVDGRSHTIVAGGSATGWHQVISLLGDSMGELEITEELARVNGAERRRTVLQREDDELAAAGLMPDDSSFFAPVSFAADSDAAAAHD